MSSNENEFSFNLDIHTGGDNWFEESDTIKYDSENDFSFVISGQKDFSYIHSDEEYEINLKDASIAMQQKHYVNIDNIDLGSSFRSEWIGKEVEDLKKRWPKSFDNIGQLRRPILVSLLFLFRREIYFFNF